MARIAVIGMDGGGAADLTTALEAVGLSCWSSRTIDEATRLLGRETFDLVLLHADGGLAATPAMVRRVRAVLAPMTPLLVILDLAEDAAVAAILEAGADDCLWNGSAERLRLARVGAALRRAASPPEGRGAWRVGAYEIDPSQAAIRLEGVAVDLTRKEFALAELLFANLGRPLSRTYALEAVWGRKPDLPSRTLDTHVSRIRRKLAFGPQHGVKLSPLYGYGYQLDLAA